MCVLEQLGAGRRDFLLLNFRSLCAACAWSAAIGDMQRCVKTASVLVFFCSAARFISQIKRVCDGALANYGNADT